MKGGLKVKVNTNKLRTIQAAECLSMNDIVKRTGLSRSSISKIFNGQQNLSPKTIGLVARALNVDVTEIFNEE